MDSRHECTVAVCVCIAAHSTNAASRLVNHPSVEEWFWQKNRKKKKLRKSQFYADYYLKERSFSTIKIRTSCSQKGTFSILIPSAVFVNILSCCYHEMNDLCGRTKELGLGGEG